MKVLIKYITNFNLIYLFIIVACIDYVKSSPFANSSTRLPVWGILAPTSPGMGFGHEAILPDFCGKLINCWKKILVLEKKKKKKVF